MPRLDIASGRVELVHGAGGRAMSELIGAIMLAAFDNPELRRGNDQAVLPSIGGRIAMTTDSFVVSPLFFPGGDIGSLAVHGTVNDLAMAGAVPVALSAAFVLEEGFPLADLARIVTSMAEAARTVGIPIVTGDTKVVERGKADGIFITTSGIGRVPEGVAPSADRAQPGDAILLSGSIGDHGMAIMAVREGLGFETSLVSDSAPLHDLVRAMVEIVPDVHVLRDPTRGGLAAALNEIAQSSRVGMRVREAAIPVRPEVAGACELLGLDPLNVANEGKLVAICAAADTDALVRAMRAHPLGRDSAIIGEVVADSSCFVEMETVFGGTRMVDWLAGEQLPRIC